jgi:RNase adaptor protein for sRNA GlmZ degradation
MTRTVTPIGHTCPLSVDVALSGYARGEFEHVTVAFGCTGGRHRSVYCAGLVRQHLLRRGYPVTIRHNALEG